MHQPEAIARERDRNARRKGREGTEENAPKCGNAPTRPEEATNQPTKQLNYLITTTYFLHSHLFSIYHKIFLIYSKVNLNN